MGGATIELAAIAVNDNEIVGNPQITFFKSVLKDILISQLNQEKL